MTIIVNLIDSFLLLLVLAASTTAKHGRSIDALKPCFERYIGQRLSDLSPYHSEWRMKTPEECLMFCALSSSRCRSTVHDIFQHICYYFLDDGQQHIQVARGMVYFRVTDKKCLDQFLNGSNITLTRSEFAISAVSSSTPKYKTATLSGTELQRPVVVHANSLIHVPPGGQAITSSPYFDYFDNQQKFKKHEKFDESSSTVATHSITTSTLPTPSVVFSKVRPERGEIYDDVTSTSKAPSRTLSTSRLTRDSVNSTSKALQQSIHQTSHSDASFFIGNVNKLPVHGTNFRKNRQKDGVNLNKLLDAIPEDIRRSLIKISVTDGEKLNEETNMIALLDAKKSLIDKLVLIPSIKSISITPSKRTHSVERIHPSSGICESNMREVWLIVENAILQSDRLERKMSAGSYKICRAKCNLITRSGRTCTSFTYDDAKRDCLTHISNGATTISSLAFLPSVETNFKVHTAIKFCYPENLFVLEKCSEFIAFLNYAINIKPREIFHDISGGYHGLRKCIELCVLSSRFHCKSAAFMITSSKCLLYDENSFSSPEHFQQHEEHGWIYFENGCEQFNSNKQISMSDRMAEPFPVEQFGTLSPKQLHQISDIYYIDN